jgi:hypothetical protein
MHATLLLSLLLFTYFGIELQYFDRKTIHYQGLSKHIGIKKFTRLLIATHSKDYRKSELRSAPSSDLFLILT